MELQLVQRQFAILDREFREVCRSIVAAKVPHAVFQALQRQYQRESRSLQQTCLAGLTTIRTELSLSQQVAESMTNRLKSLSQCNARLQSMLKSSIKTASTQFQTPRSKEGTSFEEGSGSHTPERETVKQVIRQLVRGLVARQSSVD